MNNATRKRCLVHVYQLQTSFSHRQAGRWMACPLHRNFTSPHAYGGALYSVTCSQRKYHYRSMQSWPAALPKLLCGVGVYRKRTHRSAPHICFVPGCSIQLYGFYYRLSVSLSKRTALMRFSRRTLHTYQPRS